MNTLKKYKSYSRPGISVVLMMMVYIISYDSVRAQEFIFKGQAIGWTVASQMEEEVGAPGSGDTRKVWRGQ